MIKEPKIQRSFVITKKVNEMLNEEAEKNYGGSVNHLVRKILTEYFNKNSGK